MFLMQVARSPAAHADPDICGGTPVFVGTRVPVVTLFDYLEGGETLERCLDQFPSVSRDQARAHSRFPGAVQCVGKDGL